MHGFIFIIDIMYYNPIIHILTTNKLTRPNFVN